MDFFNGTATFVIPHYSLDFQNKKFLDYCLEGVFNQSDKNWQVVIVDDNSPLGEIKDSLKKLEDVYPEKIHVIFKNSNDGPGFCRNLGVKWAYENKSPFILYNDSDDISHKNRLEKTREVFCNDCDTGVVYSTFKIIDEKNQFVPKRNVTGSILEILETHTNNPPQGKNVWIDIGTKYGYVNLTSSTSVRTELAFNCPFPPYNVAEDAHTWLRYSASGFKYVYRDDIPSLYRICQNKQEGSSSRAREGGRKEFNKKAMQIQIEGFKEAIGIALQNGGITHEEVGDLLIKLYLKLSETFKREDEGELVDYLIENAMTISGTKTKKYMNNYQICQGAKKCI